MCGGKSLFSILRSMGGFSILFFPFSSSSSFSFSCCIFLGERCIMLAAVWNGDAKKVAELMKQDPGFDMNLDYGIGFTLLHYACIRARISAVIPLLLAHPDIDVNLKNTYGQTPFYLACCGRISCVREMLKDSRVKVNEPTNDGETPLYWAAVNGYLDVIQWWIASGREMNLGEPGHYKSDAIGEAMKIGWAEVVT